MPRMPVLDVTNRKMKLLAILVCLSHKLILASDAQCRFSFRDLHCEWVDKEDFLHEFYDAFREKYATENNVIKISKGSWVSIKYFPRIPVTDGYYNFINLSINDAYIRHIDEHAFEDLKGLMSLDLSRNQLENISFVEYLPGSLNSLMLADNRILNFPSFKLNLNFLDMSQNRIRNLSFDNVYEIDVLDLSKNEIDSLFGYKSSFFFTKTSINLSHNRITKFSESNYSISYRSLDLSFNNFTVIELVEPKKQLNLSYTDVSHFVIPDYKIYCEKADLSQLKSGTNLSDFMVVTKKLKYQIGEALKLKDIKRFSLYEVDLSYSSIKSFPAHAFAGFNLQLLNLSYMNVSELNGSIFQFARLHVLDLSHSHIKVLHPNVFDGLDCSNINLSYNEISDVKNVFLKVNARKIDLSFNAFKTISNNSFESCVNLEELILSNCFIERIEPQAFIALENLVTLDLSNNKLFILEKNTFHDLPMRELKLQGNKIKTIRSRAFDGLRSLESLNLSHVQLHNLEMNAFYNLSRVEFIDLSHNDLKVVPPQLFMNTPFLAAADFSFNNISTLNKFSNKLEIQNLTLSFVGTFTSNKISNFNMRFLAFLHSSIETLKIDSFKGMYNLEELHFSNSNIRVINSGALNDLYNLRYLDSQNLFRHIEHIEGDTFRDLRSLGALNLSGLSIKTLEPNSFRGLNNIYVILLNNNTLVHLIQNTFAGLKTLEVLDLSCNQLSVIDEDGFNTLSNLRELYLQNNKLARIDSSYFKDLNTLWKLHLDHNTIGFLAPDSFLGLQNLNKLHLADNNLTRWPVGVFQYLPKLSMLNLSHNEFETIENGAFSNLLGLTVLDLSATSLIKLDEVGVFFSMRKLEYLFLDGNHLKQFDHKRLLVNLRNLRYIGISYNKWQCKDLSMMIEHFYNKSVDYKPEIPVYNSDNIDGIGCIDVCDYVYCQQEYVQSN